MSQLLSVQFRNSGVVTFNGEGTDEVLVSLKSRLMIDFRIENQDTKSAGSMQKK
jgi:hypothetical protein